MTRYLKSAGKIAARSPHPKYKHATLVFKGGSLIAVGYNHDGLHSEQVALGKLWPSKRRGVTLVNVRLSKDDSSAYSLSRPCKKCQQYLKENQIGKVYFTGRDGLLKMEKF